MILISCISHVNLVALLAYGMQQNANVVRLGSDDPGMEDFKL
jgi:hypothetical protein